MWQGSQNLHATQKESQAQNKQMTAVGYISDTEEIIKASWSNFQHDSATAFELSERSPFQSALSAKNLPGGQTKVLNVCWIRRIDHHPAERDDDSVPEGISDTGSSLRWNGDLDNPIKSEVHCEVDDESDIVCGNSIKALENPEHQVVSTSPTVPGLIWLTGR